MTHPRKATLALAVGALLAAGFADAGPAVLDVYVFDGATPLADVELTLDGDDAVVTGDQGGARLTPQAGVRRLLATRGEQVLLDLPLTLADDEQVQVSVALNGERAPIYRLVSSLSGEQTVDLAQTDSATIAGEVVDADGSPVVNAEVIVNGVSVRTDAQGRYRLSTRPGRYALLVVAPGHDTLSRPNVLLQHGEQDGPRIMLSTTRTGGAEGDTQASVLEGVSVQAEIKEDAGGQYEMGRERREAIQVQDMLSAEQMSRAGDSDAASALKRVTGLTLVGGQFVYVRGLGERYSSTLLNGAGVPSPDPTRRVVPLDMFPSGLIESIAIQKAYTPDMPGEFGGGTVALRTLSVPEEFNAKVSLGAGWRQHTTGSDMLTYDGGGRDWTGRDDGTRDLSPDILATIADGRELRRGTIFRPGYSVEELAALGRTLEATYEVRRKDAPFDGSFGLELGNGFETGFGRIGFQAAVDYGHGTESRQEELRYFVTDAQGIRPLNDYVRDRSETRIDFSGFLTLGAQIGDDHQVGANLILLRQTSDTTQIDEGFNADVAGDLRFTELLWVERELFATQLFGKHHFPALRGLELDWRYSDSDASRDAPDQRLYRFDPSSTSAPGFVFSRRSDSNTRRFSHLQDEVEDYGFDLRLPLAGADGRWAGSKLIAGYAITDKSRESSIRRFRFTEDSPFTLGNGIYALPSLEDILGHDNIRPGGFYLVENTRATDTYSAAQEIDAWYLGTNLSYDERLRLALGARHERSRQSVLTYDLFSPETLPILASLDDSDWLPALSASWTFRDNQTLRLGYSQTLSRPDFKELSEAPYTDPESGREIYGNSKLQRGLIDNFDLRWEIWPSPMEMISIGVFYKDFESPIEQVIRSVVERTFTFSNALSAENYGIELEAMFYLDRLGELWQRLDWLRNFNVAANYAWIESSIELTEQAQQVQTNAERALQGQSPYVFNLQLGYDSEDGLLNWSLLYNVFGERISGVGALGAPDILEQPVDQLDFVLTKRFEHGSALKLGLKNLLDPRVEETQGGQVRRGFRRGRQVSLSWEYAF